MANFTDHCSLIAALGGAAEVAAAEEVATDLPVNVRAWSARNRIPPEYWPGVIDLAARKGLPAVTSDWLMRTTPARRRREDEVAAA